MINQIHSEILNCMYIYFICIIYIYIFLLNFYIKKILEKKIQNSKINQFYLYLFNYKVNLAFSDIISSNISFL